MGRAEDARRMGQEGKPAPLFDPNFDMQAYRQGKLNRRPVAAAGAEVSAGGMTSEDINRYAVLSASGAASLQDAPRTSGSGITPGRILFFLFVMIAGAGMVKLAMNRSAAPPDAAPATTLANMPATVAAPEEPVVAAKSYRVAAKKQLTPYEMDVAAAAAAVARARAAAGSYPGAGVPSAAASAPAAMPVAAPSVATRTLVVTHEKGLGGGCSGQLILSASSLTFVCPASPEESFSLSVAELKPDKNGVANTAGKKFHFKSEEKSKDQMVAVFTGWLQEAQAASSR